MRQPLLSDAQEEKGPEVVLQLDPDEYSNPKFERNRKLALFTGLIITLFFVPVCSANAYACLLTKETYFIHDSGVIFSGNLTEWKASDPSTRQVLDRMAGLDLPSLLGSPDLLGYWPNIFQFMFFSVFLDFPTTVQQVYQGVAGTCLANMNYYFMLRIFPHGGECVPDVTSKIFGLKAPCTEGTYESPGYGRWGYILAILDVNVGLIFIFLLNIGLPVKKWCLSYSALFMMSYMSSAKTDSSHAVMITTLIGAALAILALCFSRLLPQVALAFKNKEDIGPTEGEKDWKVTEATWDVTETNWGPEAISKQVTEIMEYSTKFFDPNAEFGDQQRRAYAMKAQDLIQEMNDACDTMNRNLSASWWESFNLGKTGALREQMKHFAITFQFDDRFGKAGGFEEMCHIVQEAVASYARNPTKKERDTPTKKDAKEPDPTHLSEDLWEKMCTCQSETSSMLRLIARRSVTVDENACNDLDKNINARSNSLERARDQLLDSVAPSQKRTTNRSAAAMIYALTYYASEVKNYRQCDKVDWKTQIRQTIKDCILCCFWVVRDHEKEAEEKAAAAELANNHNTATFVHHKFDGHAFQDACPWMASNAFVIGAAFWMGYWFEGGMFVGYSNYLASSLAVLLGSQGPGSSFNRNLQRLLGVVLGKAIGLLAITLVALAGCESTWGLVFHLAMIFTFMSYFSYVYYEGGQWSFVCCLIVGFGCYTLGGYDLCSLWGKGIFSQRYQEIGQLTFAIVFRMAFDSLVTACRKQFPRDEVVKEMRRICWNFGPDGNECLILNSFRYLQDEKTQDSYTFLKKAKQSFTKAQELLEETHADKVLSRGKRVPFNYALLSAVLPLLERILHELDIVYLVLNHKEGSGKRRLGIRTQRTKEVLTTDADTTSWNREEANLSLKLTMTMQLLQKALEKKGMKRVEGRWTLKGDGERQHGDVKKDDEESRPGTSPAVWVVERSIGNLFYLCDEIEAAVNSKGGVAVRPTTKTKKGEDEHGMKGLRTELDAERAESGAEARTTDRAHPSIASDGASDERGDVERRVELDAVRAESGAEARTPDRARPSITSERRDVERRLRSLEAFFAEELPARHRAVEARVAARRQR